MRALQGENLVDLIIKLQLFRGELIRVYLNNKNRLNLIVNKSLISSNFVASLELVKNGFIEIKQKETFGNIYLRSK